MQIRFGTAGAPDSFFAEGYKSSLDMPEWLHRRGLNAYEYQCGRGVKIGEDMAIRLGLLAKEREITLSIHAPYYINLSTTDTVLRAKTRGHFLKTCRVAMAMNAKTVVFHPGSGSGGNRRDILTRAKKFFREILLEIDNEGYGNILLAPETMGKRNQLGSLDEVLELCQLGGQVVPAVDFGHIHALSGGMLLNRIAYELLLDRIEEVLGRVYLQKLHIHFSPVEFTSGGEKRHWTTMESQYGPDFQPLAELIAEKGLTPTIICESAGRQGEDAVIYRDIYRRISGTE